MITPDARSDSRGFTFAAVGQSLIKRDIRQWLDGPAHALVAPIRAADVAFTNFEATVWGRHGGWPMKIDSFGGVQPDVLDALCSMGFTVLSLTNNHAFDLGPGGVLSTMEEVERRGLLHAGVGRDRTDAGKARSRAFPIGDVALHAMDGCGQPDAYYAMDGAGPIPGRPGLNRQRFLRGPKSGSLEPSTRHNSEHSSEPTSERAPDPEDADRNLAQIAAAAQTARFVICYIHHHIAYQHGSTPAYVRRFSRACVAAGANVVIWDGTPALQGIEVYRRRPLIYGLSNFIFHTGKPDFWRERLGHAPWRTALVRCDFDESGDLRALRVTPVKAGGDRAQAAEYAPHASDAPRPATGAWGADILAEVVRLSADLGMAFTAIGDEAHWKP